MLAEQYKKRINDGSRSLGGRVHAAICYTLLPSSDHFDIISLYNQLEKEESMPLCVLFLFAFLTFTKLTEKVPIAVMEVIIRGCVRTTDPLASLSFLLSPPLLFSDRARVVTPAINSCVHHMHV